MWFVDARRLSVILVPRGCYFAAISTDLGPLGQAGERFYLSQGLVDPAFLRILPPRLCQSSFSRILPPRPRRSSLLSILPPRPC